MEPHELISFLEKSIHDNDLLSDKVTQKKITEQLKREVIVITLQKQAPVFWNNLIKRLATLEENDTRLLVNSFLAMYEKKEAFINFIIVLDDDVIRLICKCLPIKKHIASALTFSEIMAPLSISQRSPIYDAMVHYLPALVTDALSLGLVFKFCTELQRKSLYKAVLLHLKKTMETNFKIKKIHPPLTSTSLASSYSRISSFFNVSGWGSRALYDAHPSEEESIKQEVNNEQIWSSLVQNSRDFYNLMRYLPLKYREEIYSTIKNRLLNLLKNAKDIYFIMSCLSLEQKNDFFNLAFSNDAKTCDDVVADFEIIKLPLEQFINNENDFAAIYNQLTPEQVFVLGKKIHSKILSIFKKTACFTAIAQKLSLEQFQALCESIPDKLCYLIYELADFQKLSELSYDKQYVFLKNAHPYLADFLNRKIFCCDEGFDPLMGSLYNLNKELKSYYEKVCGETVNETDPVNLQFFYKDKAPIEIKTSSELMTCMNINEWTYVANKTQFEYEKQLIETGSGIQYFVNFLENLKKNLSSQDSSTSFFDFYFDLMEIYWIKFIKNSADFYWVVSAFNTEEKEKFFTLTETIIPQYIHSFIDLKLIFMPLSRAQKLKIYEQISQDLWLKADNLEALLAYFNQVLPEDYQRIQTNCLINFIAQLERSDKKTPHLTLFIKECKERLEVSSLQENILFFRQSLEQVIEDLHLEAPSALDILLKKIAITLKNPEELLIFSPHDFNTIKPLPNEPLILKKTLFKELEYLKKENTSEAFAKDRIRGFYFLRSLLRSFLKEEASTRGIAYIKIMGEKICSEGEQVFLFEEDSTPISTSFVEQELSFFPTVAYKTYLPPKRQEGFSEEEFKYRVWLAQRQTIVRQTLMNQLGRRKSYL